MDLEWCAVGLCLRLCTTSSLRTGFSGQHQKLCFKLLFPRSLLSALPHAIALQREWQQNAALTKHTTTCVATVAAEFNVGTSSSSCLTKPPATHQQPPPHTALEKPSSSQSAPDGSTGSSSTQPSNTSAAHKVIKVAAVLRVINVTVHVYMHSYNVYTTLCTTSTECILNFDAFTASRVVASNCGQASAALVPRNVQAPNLRPIIRCNRNAPTLEERIHCMDATRGTDIMPRCRQNYCPLVCV